MADACFGSDRVSRLASVRCPHDNATQGEVAEWSNAAVLKTVVRLRGPGVRIPPSPPLTKYNYLFTIQFIWYCHVNYPGQRELVKVSPSDTRHLLVHIKCFGS